jgi:hypothetical protein
MAKNISRDPAEGDRWDAVSARALCFLCLTAADLRDEGIVPQAKLLEALGLSRKETAAMLGTTPSSITELYRQAKNRKGSRRNDGKKKSR